MADLLNRRTNTLPAPAVPEIVVPERRPGLLRRHRRAAAFVGTTLTALGVGAAIKFWPQTESVTPGGSTNPEIGRIDLGNPDNPKYLENVVSASPNLQAALKAYFGVNDLPEFTKIPDVVRKSPSVRFDFARHKWMGVIIDKPEADTNYATWSQVVASGRASQEIGAVGVDYYRQPITFPDGSIAYISTAGSGSYKDLAGVVAYAHPGTPQERRLTIQTELPGLGQLSFADRYTKLGEVTAAFMAAAFPQG